MTTEHNKLNKNNLYSDRLFMKRKTIPESLELALKKTKYVRSIKIVFRVKNTFWTLNHTLKP